jgi:5-methylcytosine-specific restriction protein A
MDTSVNAPTLRRFDWKTHGFTAYAYRNIVLYPPVAPIEQSAAPAVAPEAPPAQPSTKHRPGWAKARRERLEFDNWRCCKCHRCGLPSDGILDVHHIVERVFDGSDDLANLVTLCSDCHQEWTFCQPGLMSFPTWLTAVPARFLVEVFALEWPDDITARAFKEQIRSTLALVRAERSKAADRRVGEWRAKQENKRRPK